MKTALSNFIIFATGAVIGSVVTWKIIKTKYEQIAQEEIDSVKEVFSKKEDDLKWEYSGEPIGKIVSVEKTEDGVYNGMKEYLEKGFCMENFNPEKYNEDIIKKLKEIIK